MRGALGALLLLIPAHQTSAAEYTLMIYESPEDIAARSDRGESGKAYWNGYAQIGRDLARAGILKGGAALDPVSEVRSVSAPGGKTEVANSGVRAGKSMLGGYFIIDVPDLATAIAWAGRIPASAKGVVEVRPHAPAQTGM